MQIHLHSTSVKFVYQGHRVKVKVAAAKGQTNVTKYTHSAVDKTSFLVFQRTVK